MKIIKQSQSGFTLIELMITVAIVAILAAIAIPAYQDYVARSQVAEALSLVSGAKPLVAEFHSNNGVWPTQTQVGYSGATGKYISGTSIDTNGVIIATLGGDANSKITGQSITLTPTIQPEGNISWNCTSSLDAKYLPSSCTHVDSSNGGNGGTGGTGGNNGGSNPNPVLGYIDNIYVVQNGQLIDNSCCEPGPLPLISTDPDGTQHYKQGSLNLSLSPDGVLQYSLNNGDTMKFYTDQTGMRLVPYQATDANGNLHQNYMPSFLNQFGSDPIPTAISQAFTALSQVPVAYNITNINGIDYQLMDQQTSIAYQAAYSQLQQAIRNSIAAGDHVPNSYRDFLNVSQTLN